MLTEDPHSSTNENKRVNALHGHNILDTPEHQFDNIAKLASLICSAPIALIALVDEDRVWFKSLIGITFNEIPRGISFCEHTILGDGVFEVYDALVDDRFKNHPSVIEEPHVRSYAGALLIDENGFKLGTVCVFDVVPRQFSDNQKEGLETLAKEVMMHISLKTKTEQLAAKTHRFEELLDISAVSPEIHCILDSQGKVLFINDSVTNILEYSVQEAIGLNMWGFCHRDDLDLVVETIECGLRKGTKQFLIDFRIVSKTGVIRWISWTMVTKNSRWYTYGRDITDNKKVESELQVLSLVASETNTGVNISDAKGYTTWVNHSLEQLIGYSITELQGKRLGDILSTEIDDAQRLLITESRARAQNKQAYSIEVQAAKKDGTPVWLAVSNTPIIDANGNLERQIDLITDITQRKQVEREMVEAKEQALQLSEAKEMFLSVMSHEIRTPLNAVIGITHLLIENDPKPSQVEDLNILKFSGENLLNIINDILDFTKIETGNLQLESFPFSLKALTSDIITSLSVNAGKKNDQLELLYDDQIPELVQGDKTRLYQILMNLLGNAIKFTDGGKISLKLNLIALHEEHVEIHFDVTDNGIGIPEDKLNYIFETFTQAKTDISRKYGGTGLGLAITKKLLELYHSEIQVCSSEGVGTSFSFTLNFGTALAAYPEFPPAVQSAVFNGKRILIVDDNEINLLIARRILGNLGLHIDFAFTGEEAIEKIQQDIYDLVFMDIKMPGMDGFEATRSIRNIPGDYFRNVPIIALTASILHNEHNKFKDSGMNGHILKPFKPDDIRNLLSVHL
ncbi:ATP-binding protein [Pedobacter nyackensis]|uniref:histidine kinase n=1 Tax=Pedobacter nyackensis TaxID=475255 RepID=A0A1W2C3G4_9SPHI|nr:ATP-binding protein [Pedobacter nyackensis]SMC79641.1 PAS domain S-box-containing protein [Pedobacter nyackensis]